MTYYDLQGAKKYHNKSKQRETPIKKVKNQYISSYTVSAISSTKHNIT